jgi:hypothetical protein
MSQLFEPVPPEGNWRLNAIIGWSESDHLLAIGFHELGAHGVQRIIEGGPDDSLFVPIVYNYRHAYELVLKTAIREAARVVRNDDDLQGHPHDVNLAPKALDDRLSREHSLGVLLDELTELLVRGRIEPLPTETIDTIRQLHGLDPSGQGFRYSRVKVNKVLVPARPTQQHVDVAAVGQRLSEGFQLISGGLLSVLQVAIEAQQDMLSAR